MNHCNDLVTRRPSIITSNDELTLKKYDDKLTRRPSILIFL